MTARATIRIDTDPVVRGLARLRELGRDLTPVMDEVGAMLVTSTQQRFETGTAPDGTPWPVSGRARRQGGQTLVDDGRLRDSITHDPGADAVTVGTNVVYAAVHQFGATITPESAQALAFPGPDGGTVFAQQVQIPPRPFIGVSDADEAEIGNIVADHVREAFGREAFGS